MSLLGHALMRALDKPLPTRAALAKRGAEEPKRVLILVDEMKAGGATLATTGATLAVLDGVSDSLDASAFDRCIHALATVRAVVQGHDKPWTFGVAECAVLRRMLGVYKPSQIAKMLRFAAKDSFWRTQTLSMMVVETHAAAWLAAASSPGAAKATDRRAEMMREMRTLLDALKKKAPMLAESLDVDVSKFPIESLAAHLATIETECRKRSITKE